MSKTITINIAIDIIHGHSRIKMSAFKGAISQHVRDVLWHSYEIDNVVSSVKVTEVKPNASELARALAKRGAGKRRNLSPEERQRRANLMRDIVKRRRKP